MDDSVTTSEDTPVTVNVAFNDTDVDDNLDPSSAAVLTGPANGTAANNDDGTFTYIPDENFNGADSFTYKICDTDGACGIATVSIDVTPVNDPPVAVDDNVTTLEDTPVAINAASNDFDVDGNLVPTGVVVLTDPANGTAGNNGDGTFTYTPNENFNGADSFTYQICDTDGACDEATVTINVTPVNDPPVVVDDTYNTDQNVELVIAAPGTLGNDTDLDGDKLFVADYDATSAFDGAVVVNSDGSFTYTPGDLFAGMDTFTYQACDFGEDGIAGNDDDLCGTATVTITVQTMNQRSILVEAYDFTPEDIEPPNGVFETLSGSFLITNTSNLQPSEVQISSMEVGVEVRYGSKGGYTPIDPTSVSCSFDPTPSFVFATTQLVNYVCTLSDSLDAGGFEAGDTVRVTTYVNVFEGHRPFKNSFSKLIDVVAAAPALVSNLPGKNALRPNYPNPFNPETWVPFELAEDADVRVEIYNVTGRLVRTLELGYRPAGYHLDRSRAAHWDGRNKSGENVASGVYFYKLTAGDFSAMRRMVILK